MRKIFPKAVLAFIFFIAAFTQAQHKFEIDFTADTAYNSFNVTVYPEKLTPENNIYQFAAIAPGTYQINDIGRYVQEFAAFDSEGNSVPVENVSVNQWKLSDPGAVSKIEYTIAETWDTPVEENNLYPMCGTSLEEDHCYFNSHCVLGYFHGMQDEDMWITFKKPGNWGVGTPLELNDEDYYTAESFDRAVDSPFLFGKITAAAMDVEGTEIEVYTYSMTDKINSEDLLEGLSDILFAASDFTEGLPVDRYVFLFHFGEISAGAWEHSYSSNYVLTENDLTPQMMASVKSTAAHEFFHVMTPLNMHSELIEEFNFVEPELSRHLWLYEGVTEWASDAMQLRDSLITVEQYLGQIRQKLNVNDNFDQSVSLTELGIHAADEHSSQYANIYMKGAVIGTLLDIRLLELSEGTRGLREVLNELADKYGPNNPFSEENFFNELTDITYPEIGDFINNYIAGTEPMPVEDYFSKIGIEYTEFAGYDSTRITIDFGLGLDGQKIVVNNVKNEASGIKAGDILHKMDTTVVTLKNAQQAFMSLASKKPGNSLEITFIRDGEEVVINYVFPPMPIKHKFAVLESPTAEQKKLFDAWTRNL